MEENTMIGVAVNDGLMYTKWGPCFCPEPHGTCVACLNAQRIEDAGLDWEDEFQKAVKAGTQTEL